MNLKIIVYILPVILLIIIYIYGHRQGTLSCQQSQSQSIIKEDIKHEKVEEKVMSLSDVELRKSFCQWVRDDKQKCLQAHIPISE